MIFGTMCIQKAQDQISKKQGSIPKCQGNVYSQWSNCKGIYKNEIGHLFIGQFKDGKILEGNATYAGAVDREFVYIGAGDDDGDDDDDDDDADGADDDDDDGGDDDADADADGDADDDENGGRTEDGGRRTVDDAAADDDGCTACRTASLAAWATRERSLV